MTFWSNEDGIFSRAVTEAVHADLANANFSGRIKRGREDSCDERLTTIVHLPVTHSTIMWVDPYDDGTLAEDDIEGHHVERILWKLALEERRTGLSPLERMRMEVRVAVELSTQRKKSGEGGCVKSDGAGVDDEDGGRGENNLEATYHAGSQTGRDFRGLEVLEKKRKKTERLFHYASTRTWIMIGLLYGLRHEATACWILNPSRRSMQVEQSMRGGRIQAPSLFVQTLRARWSGAEGLIKEPQCHLVNADLGGGDKRTGQYSCDKCLAAIVFLPVRDHGAVVWADPYGSSLAEDDVGTSKGSTLRRYSAGEDWEKGGEGIELHYTYEFGRGNVQRTTRMVARRKQLEDSDRAGRHRRRRDRRIKCYDITAEDMTPPPSLQTLEQINGGGIGESQSHIWREEGRKDGKEFLHAITPMNPGRDLLQEESETKGRRRETSVPASRETNNTNEPVTGDSVLTLCKGWKYSTAEVHWLEDEGIEKSPSTRNTQTPRQLLEFSLSRMGVQRNADSRIIRIYSCLSSVVTRVELGAGDYNREIDINNEFLPSLSQHKQGETPGLTVSTVSTDMPVLRYIKAQTACML
ncbi:hypothetical protein EDD85DRAFT_791035 [Armillaria nabsnona]|nr:hypothetical protein EDD85DRAFT_791035 [Armillaria nabsnona]